MDLKKVISKIKPKESSIKKEIDETVKIINSELKKNKIKAAASVGGSFAKDTHLADDHDCDIFVRFDFKYKDTNLSDLLQKCLRKFKPERVHGSRDYFLFSNNLNFEVVPVLNISKPDRAVNVTDVSPLHVAWTKKHKKSDEIKKKEAALNQKPTIIIEKGLEDDVKKVLQLTDTLLEKLPDEEIEKFAKTKEFELYKKVMKEIR